MQLGCTLFVAAAFPFLLTGTALVTWQSPPSTGTRAALTGRAALAADRQRRSCLEQRQAAAANAAGSAGRLEEEDGPCLFEGDEEDPTGDEWDGLITTKVDMFCPKRVLPASDDDIGLGHGRPECRYEPSAAELEKYTLNPEDIAIAMPSDSAEDSNAEETERHQSPGGMWDARVAWATYAKFHGYVFYPGPPLERWKVNETCPGIHNYTGHWTKPCVARHLVKEHRYVLVVDRDTMVLKPLLRLEPLFALAGLTDASTGKVMAVAEEWGSCKNGIRAPRSGDVNTGILLLKQSNLTDEALGRWWSDPTECEAGGNPFEWEAALTPPFRPWPFDSYCSGCACLRVVRKEWMYDQLAFFVSVVNRTRYQSNITVFKSGCPINSPFADFIAHFVSGTPSHRVYNLADRPALVAGVWQCTERILLQGTGNATGNSIYERCAICDALPQSIRERHEMGAWMRSCPTPGQPTPWWLPFSPSRA